jgi:hypothetical protein
MTLSGIESAIFRLVAQYRVTLIFRNIITLMKEDEIGEDVNWIRISWTCARKSVQ